MEGHGWRIAFQAPDLVRTGSAKHRKPLVLGGHDRSAAVNENRTSDGQWRSDLAQRISLGPGSSPSSGTRQSPHRPGPWGSRSSSLESVWAGPVRTRTLGLMAVSPRAVPVEVVVFWAIAGLVLALVLLAARAVDRRDRRRGHHLRSGGEMAHDAWEQRRDTVASDRAGHMDADRSWTDRSRQVEHRSRQPDERPGS
jgi:hypothetical protein